jgi:hypothetical protein
VQVYYQDAKLSTTTNIIDPTCNLRAQLCTCSAAIHNVQPMRYAYYNYINAITLIFFTFQLKTAICILLVSLVQ